MPELLQTDPAIKNGVFEWRPNCTSLTSKASPPDDRLWDLLIVLEDNGDPARTYVDETATWFACSETRASLSSSSSSKTTTLPFRLWSTSLPWIPTNEKCQFEWFLEAQTMRLMQVMVRFSWSCLRSLSSPAGSSSSFRFHATARFSTCEVEWGKNSLQKDAFFTHWTFSRRQGSMPENRIAEGLGKMQRPTKPRLLAIIRNCSWSIIHQLDYLKNSHIPGCCRGPLSTKEIRWIHLFCSPLPSSACFAQVPDMHRSKAYENHSHFRNHKKLDVAIVFVRIKKYTVAVWCLHHRFRI